SLPPRPTRPGRRGTRRQRVLGRRDAPICRRIPISDRGLARFGPNEPNSARSRRRQLRPCLRAVHGHSGSRGRPSRRHVPPRTGRSHLERQALQSNPRPQGHRRLEYLKGNPIHLISRTSARFSRGLRGIVRVPAIKGDWASSEGRLVLGFVLIVVSGARITRRLAGFSVADRVVRMVGRRIVFAGLGVGPGPIVTLGVVELVAARFAPGRIRGVRGPGRVQDGRRRAVRSGPEGLLWIASALLLGTNLLLVLAVFVNVIGGLGPVNPSRILWAALGMDLVGVALLGWIIWDSAARVDGPPRVIRWMAALLLFLWVGLTA